MKLNAMRPVAMLAAVGYALLVNAESAAQSASDDAERIVFSSLRPGNWDIYHFARAGAEPTRLTDHPGLDYDATFSPDGRWVVFTSERRGNPDLFALDLEDSGAAPRLLIDSPAMEDQAAFSPDGRMLAFVGTTSGNAEIYTIRFDPSTAQRIEAAENLTQHPGGDFRPDYSPDGSRIAFSSDRDTPVYGHPMFSFTRQREGEVYVMRTDGSEQRRLTESTAWDGSPEWARDGETIYFYSARPRELPGPPTSPILGQEGGFRIWAMAADGSDARPVTPEGLEALAPALTADGRVAFQTRTGYADWTIRSVRPDGTGARLEATEDRNYWTPDYDTETGAMVAHGVGPTRVETQAVEAILGAGALLAADYPAQVAVPGRASVTLYPMRHTTGLAPHPFRNDVAVTIENESGTRLVTADFDGGGQQELFSVPDIGIVSDSPHRIFDIKWAESGDWITYTQGYFFGQAENASDIWITRPDGRDRRNLTQASAANDGVAAFSPDGNEIVFRSSRNGQFDLYLMDRDGTNVRQLTNSTARENFPVFSPGGDAVAFSSDADGAVDRFGNRTFENYILELEDDGTAGRLSRISDHPGQDAHPWYSPDGDWVVYTSEQAGISDEEPLVQEVVFGPQMYGELFARRLADGLTVRLTHNKWEEGNPFWLRPAQASVAQAGDEGVPDFSGTWAAETWSTEGWPLEPPYTQAGRAAQDEWAGNPQDDPSHRCIVPLGRIISAPFPHEIIQQDERLTLLYEYDHQVRRVFMDGRHHPDSYPTLMGHSIGRWEEDALVIETANLEGGLFRPQGLPYTENLRLIERLELLDGGDRMRVTLTIHDPDYYREPWNVTKHYARTDEPIKDYECIVREHLSAAPEGGNGP